MNLVSRRSLAVGVFGGIVNSAIVYALLTYFDNPLFRSGSLLSSVVVEAFLLGFLALALAAHTGLIAPAGGFAASLGGIAYLEVTSPAPEKMGELGGHAIVDGPFYVWYYADTWYVWVSLLVVAGVAEYAIRFGYDVGTHRLRNLPAFPPTRSDIAALTAGAGALVGASTILLLSESFTTSVPILSFVFLLTAAGTAAPLLALVSRGVVTPLGLYALYAPASLITAAITSTDGPVWVSLFGFGLVLAPLLWKLEELLRSRYLGWNGGRFTG